MRVWIAAAALVLPACRPYMAPPEPPPLEVARSPVRVVRVPEAPERRLSLVVRAGSAYDPASREGLAFLVAHAVASRVGASATLDVGPELVQLVVSPADAPRLLAALAAPLDSEALAFARARALAQLRPADCLSWAATIGPAWLFAGHPYGHPAPGRLSTIPTITLAEAQAFRDARWVRDAVVIAVDGAVDPAELPAFDAVFAPALSRSPTPAVRPREARPDAVVEAPVTSACIAWGPRRAADTSVATRALFRRAQSVLGGDLVARVDPYAFWTSPAEGDGFGAWQAWTPPTAVSPGPTPSPSSAGLAAALLVDAVFGLPPSAAVADAAARLGDDEVDAFVKGTLSRDNTVRLVVTPSAKTWRSAESSPTFVVLDHEALIR